MSICDAWRSALAGPACKNCCYAVAFHSRRNDCKVAAAWSRAQCGLGHGCTATTVSACELVRGVRLRRLRVGQPVPVQRPMHGVQQLLRRLQHALCHPAQYSSTVSASALLRAVERASCCCSQRRAFGGSPPQVSHGGSWSRSAAMRHPAAWSVRPRCCCGAGDIIALAWPRTTSRVYRPRGEAVCGWLLGQQNGEAACSAALHARKACSGKLSCPWMAARGRQ